MIVQCPRLALVAAMTFAFTAPSLAETRFDNACHYLWVARNDIYKEQGYCFKTARAIAYFGNEACPYASEAAVPLTPDQHRAIDDIIRQEIEKGCRRS